MGGQEVKKGGLGERGETALMKERGSKKKIRPTPTDRGPAMSWKKTGNQTTNSKCGKKAKRRKEKKIPSEITERQSKSHGAGGRRKEEFCFQKGGRAKETGDQNVMYQKKHRKRPPCTIMPRETAAGGSEKERTSRKKGAMESVSDGKELKGGLSKSKTETRFWGGGEKQMPGGGYGRNRRVGEESKGTG